MITLLLALALQNEKAEYKGVSYELPKSWKTEKADGAVRLLPEGANPRGVLEEAYALLNDPAVTSIDGDKILSVLDGLKDQLHPGATRKSAEAKKLGELDGRYVLYTGEDDSGRAVEIRFWVFLGEGAGCALLAFGYKDVIDGRQKDLDAILASMKKGASSKKESEEVPKTVKRIEGAKMQRFRGIAFDLPKNWKIQVTSDGTLVMPEGANSGGVLEELYLLVSDPSIQSLDGAEFLKSLDETAGKLQPGARRQGDPAKKAFGDLEGRAIRYQADAQGKVAEIRVYAFMTAAGVGGLVALGYADVIAKRDADLEAILGSLWRPKSKGTNPEELVGEWAYMKNIWNNDGGSQTNSFIKLKGDGTYEVYGESSLWVNPGAVGPSSQWRETGTWSATESTLTLTPNGGEARTYGMEKRNHPKNTSDPMIVLDGKAFVTTTRRAPWKE